MRVAALVVLISLVSLGVVCLVALISLVSLRVVCLIAARAASLVITAGISLATLIAVGIVSLLSLASMRVTPLSITVGARRDFRCRPRDGLPLVRYCQRDD